MNFVVCLSGKGLCNVNDNSYKIESFLLGRLEKTIELWENLKNQTQELYIIVSGGEKPIPCAPYMKLFLMEKECQRIEF